MLSEEESAVYEYYLTFFSKLNGISITFLFLFGLFGNSIMLVTLAHKNAELPRIACKNYLILLTIVNTLYMTVHWLTSTQAHLNSNFHLFSHLNELINFNANVMVCKSLGYLKNVCRFMSVILTAIFSVERLCAVYFPLKLINLKRSYMRMMGLDILLVLLLSTLATSYVLFFMNIVPVDANLITTSSRIRFTYMSLNPSVGKTYCSVSSADRLAFLKFYRITLCIIIIAYLLISVSLILLVKKLRQQRRFRLLFRSANQMAETTFQQQSEVEVNETVQVRSQSGYLAGRLHCERVKFHTNKFQNSRMLIVLASCFLVSSLPYYTSTFMNSFFFNGNIANSTRQYRMLTLKTQIFFNLTEILKCANYSLTGVLFVCSGKIFRLHLKRMFTHLVTRK